MVSTPSGKVEVNAIKLVLMTALTTFIEQQQMSALKLLANSALALDENSAWAWSRDVLISALAHAAVSRMAGFATA